ncbi:CaiB/BaiF CoA transferase family protein [Rhodovulum euryhalinum]|uniref:Alpha-methylacyl-CoA racemase n=1 Tax=Rhodovulum euryhalinum TaxID=35805 RepID=A0A4R2KI29_9RHOB|nr:CaiB/BaiF CoA-transferase family protein [Rhodovulum euryhalinum]TCO72824.1 alpha-methylacyl-CoA racemase [Rhodovulum euryhalinum]
MTGALDGLRIVEFVGLGPAPFAAMMLADHGAEVLRIHPPARRSDIATMDSPADVLARSRACVSLDLKSGAGRAMALDLIAEADGLIEGFRPGVMERLGLGPAEGLSRNPRLVYGRMTGWGQDGPLAARAGHDINYIALTGVLDAIGPADRPAVPLNLVGDFGGGGMLMAFGMLAGLISAARTGQGQVVDAAMTDGAALLSAMIHGFRAGGAWGPGRAANMLDGGAFYYGVYACADGRFVAVGAIEPQFLVALLTGLGLDPAAFQPQDDRTRWPAWRACLAAAFQTRTRAEWLARFEGVDACLGPVLDWDEAQAHPHNAARATFVEAGGVPQPAPAPRFSATPAPRPSPPETDRRDPAVILARWRGR